MWWFDTEGRRARLLTAEKEANSFANYNTEHKIFHPLGHNMCGAHIMGTKIYL